MATGVRYYTIIAAVCILLPGCSSTPHPASSRMPASPDPGADPALDHFIARLPYHLADTATEARAITHVAIGRAKARTGNNQCGRPWLIIGPASGSAGPHLANAAGDPAWYYRISHQPAMAVCGNTSREVIYDALQETLPAWITLRRAEAATPDAGSTPLIKASR